MRITALEIEGFGNYERLALHFEKPINIFVGRNDAGKTTLANAIRWAVSGRAVTRTKKGQEALINDHAKRARVKLTIDGNVEIERTRTPRTEMLRFSKDGVPTPGSPSEVQAAIYRYLGAQTEAAAEALQLGLRPEVWFERSDRHQLLQQLFPEQVSACQARGRAGDGCALGAACE